MEANARAHRITEKVDVWAAGDMLSADLYGAELANFRDRYFENGELTYHYPVLDPRKSDHPDLVEAVIRGANNDPRDRVLALLMIVWPAQQSLSRRQMGVPDPWAARELHAGERHSHSGARTPRPVGPNYDSQDLRPWGKPSRAAEP
jgi:hypothetical protein